MSDGPKHAGQRPFDVLEDSGDASVTDRIPTEEEALLGRVLLSLTAARTAAARRPTVPQRVRRAGGSGAGGDGGDVDDVDDVDDVERNGGDAAKPRRGYDEAMVALRDEISEARLEDVPALVAQMERLQEVSLTRAELQTILIDPASPYFGHLRLRERIAGRGEIERDVMIGRATFSDPRARIHIVDWRNAPVSQLYYRYAEGSDYEEQFGDREVEGDILVRRTVTIDEGGLLRIACAQGVWVKQRDGEGDGDGGWERTEVEVHELAGGEEVATRPARRFRPSGVLGAAPAAGQRLDRHLPEIAALIDPRQFEVMTSRHAGVVVIQGGAGSGKTTIGLHRLAYLAYSFPDRFPPRRMLVVTTGVALAAYIGQVLPALGIDDVRVSTFHEWAEKELRAAVPWITAKLIDDSLPSVTRVKSHPALLHELERRAAAYRGKKTSRAVVELWAELLTDRARLLALVNETTDMPVTVADVIEAHRIMVTRVAAIVSGDPRDRPPEKKTDKRAAKKRRSAEAEEVRAPGAWAEFGLAENPRRENPISELPEHVRRVESERDDVEDDDNIRGEIGIDGLRTEDDQPLLDIDDVAILLRAHQLLRGVKQPLGHLFVDEAQDLSPMKLAVLIGHTSSSGSPSARAGRSPSITLAGDTAQRLFLDNGFGDWRDVLGHLGLGHVAVEPLRIAYRSTREILQLARHAMGPLADAVVPHAPRVGAPVEAFRFSAAGAAVAFLAEALRDLGGREPRATVALLARHPEQADVYFEGLRRAEVPSLRRVRAQEFTFRPGIEVTDVRQVKGLEFDYVIMLDVNASSYGTDDESRHLFHIGVTRAAHQLWLVITGIPSALCPADVLSA